MTANNTTEKVTVVGCCGPSTVADSASRVTWRGGRTIGPWGTTLRAATGVAAIALGVAVPHRSPLFDLPGAGSNLVGLLVGMVAVPVALTLATWARGRDAPRLQLGPGAASIVTLMTIGAAQVYPVVVWVSIGAPLVLLAALGRDGCELLAVPNLVLGRNDYLFCLPFSPIDTWERQRRTPSPSLASASSNSPAAVRRLRG